MKKVIAASSHDSVMFLEAISLRITPRWNAFLEVLKQNGCQRRVIVHRMNLKWRSLNTLSDITTKSGPINIMVALTPNESER